MPRMIAGRESITTFLDDAIEQLRKPDPTQSELHLKLLIEDLNRLLRPIADPSMHAQREPMYGAEQLGIGIDQTFQLRQAVQRAYAALPDCARALELLEAARGDW
jgi:hypothetical protein